MVTIFVCGLFPPDETVGDMDSDVEAGVATVGCSTCIEQLENAKAKMRDQTRR